MNTTDFLSIAAAICPDRDAIVFEDQKLSYDQLNQRVDRLSNAFAGLGIKKGERIAILQVNCPQYIETYFAAAKQGIIFVPLNFRAKENELSYMIGHAEVKALLAGKRYIDIVRHMLPGLPGINHCISIDEKMPDMLFYDDIINAFASKGSEVDTGDDDITILMYTAGTTGLPKGVPLRHNGFVSYVLENVTPADPETSEKNLLTVPLYHVAGMQAMLAAVYGGRTIVLMKQFEVKEWLETVQREKATRAMLVPTMLKNIIDNPDFSGYDLSSLQVITYGAAPMPFDVITRAIKVMPGVKFINAFGQTETASTITMLSPDDHVIEGTDEQKQKKLERLQSSIGKPLADVEVRIVDDNWQEVPAGQTGNIVARGQRVMSGYWQDEQKTKNAFTTDGWLITGDRGWMDEDGYIFLAGRGDDMIIRGGENISPEEIENVLYSNPKIEEAAVIGIPDPEWGQVPRAVVVLKKNEKATEEEIVEYCRERLASFKRPRSVVFVDELPRNALGKMLKKKLREQYGN